MHDIARYQPTTRPKIQPNHVLLQSNLPSSGSIAACCLPAPPYGIQQYTTRCECNFCQGLAPSHPPTHPQAGSDCDFALGRHSSWAVCTRGPPGTCVCCCSTRCYTNKHLQPPLVLSVQDTLSKVRLTVATQSSSSGLRLHKTNQKQVEASACVAHPPSLTTCSV